MNCGIYLWTNNITKKCYVGRSINLKSRFNYYFNSKMLVEAKHSLICRALLKYGHDNFTLEIIEYTTEEEISEREKYWISKLNPAYNLVTVVDGRYSYSHTEISRKKMSKFQLARFANPEQRKKLSDLHDNWARSLKNINQLLNAQKKWLSNPENRRISLPFLKRKRVSVFDIQTSVSKMYDSLTEAANKIKCARSTISRYLLLKDLSKCSSPIRRRYIITLIEK